MIRFIAVICCTVFLTGCATAIDNATDNWWRYQETHGKVDPNIKYCLVKTDTGGAFVPCPKKK